jgi:hypothetical protein
MLGMRVESLMLQLQLPYGTRECVVCVVMRPVLPCTDMSVLHV